VVEYLAQPLARGGVAAGERALGVKHGCVKRESYEKRHEHGGGAEPAVGHGLTRRWRWGATIRPEPAGGYWGHSEVSSVRPGPYRCRMTTHRGPIPNSCRLLDGRLIRRVSWRLGDAPARAKLDGLLDAGFTCFVDLTEPHELDLYDRILVEEAAKRGVRARHVRLPIIDVSVPSAPEQMRTILDTIDAELAASGGYVHCWGGVGRTGTVVGCHLVRSGMTGDAALAQVAELFKSTEKYPRRKRSLETDEQDAYLRSWVEPSPNVGTELGDNTANCVGRATGEL
jgi:protein-tyrosine phosphatase